MLVSLFVYINCPSEWEFRCGASQIGHSAKKGIDKAYGARPLRRAIQRYVEDEISEMILRNEVHEGQNITVNFENENLKFDVN